MYNKKGTAFEEFVGLGAFSFAVLIGLLFLFGCRVYEKTRVYEEFEFSKEELEATKALNAFLGMPVDEERNVMGVIIKSYQDKDYCEFDKIAREHFSEIYNDWRLTLNIESLNHYNSYDCGPLEAKCTGFDMSKCHSGPSSLVAESEVKLPILNEDLELTELMVLLQIRE